MHCHSDSSTTESGEADATNEQSSDGGGGRLLELTLPAEPSEQGEHSMIEPSISTEHICSKAFKSAAAQIGWQTFTGGGTQVYKVLLCMKVTASADVNSAPVASLSPSTKSLCQRCVSCLVEANPGVFVAVHHTAGFL